MNLVYNTLQVYNEKYIEMTIFSILLKPPQLEMKNIVHFNVKKL